MFDSFSFQLDLYIYVSFSLTRRRRPHFLVQRRIIGSTSVTVWLRSKEPMMGSALSNPSLRYEDFFVVVVYSDTTNIALITY